MRPRAHTRQAKRSVVVPARTFYFLAKTGCQIEIWEEEEKTREKTSLVVNIRPFRTRSSTAKKMQSPSPTAVPGPLSAGSYLMTHPDLMTVAQGFLSPADAGRMVSSSRDVRTAVLESENQAMYCGRTTALGARCWEDALNDPACTGYCRQHIRDELSEADSAARRISRAGEDGQAAAEFELKGRDFDSFTSGRYQNILAQRTPSGADLFRPIFEGLSPDQYHHAVVAGSPGTEAEEWSFDAEQVPEKLRDVMSASAPYASTASFRLRYDAPPAPFEVARWAPVLPPSQGWNREYVRSIPAWMRA